MIGLDFSRGLAVEMSSRHKFPMQKTFGIYVTTACISTLLSLISYRAIDEKIRRKNK